MSKGETNKRICVKCGTTGRWQSEICSECKARIAKKLRFRSPFKEAGVWNSPTRKILIGGKYGK